VIGFESGEIIGLLRWKCSGELNEIATGPVNGCLKLLEFGISLWRVLILGEESSGELG